jgi:hypothetical protein
VNDDRIAPWSPVSEQRGCVHQVSRVLQLASIDPFLGTLQRVPNNVIQVIAIQS